MCLNSWLVVVDKDTSLAEGGVGGIEGVADAALLLERAGDAGDRDLSVCSSSRVSPALLNGRPLLAVCRLLASMIRFAGFSNLNNWHTILANTCCVYKDI